MSRELAQRENAIKKHVVETLGYRDSKSRLFQVWQPHIDALAAAYEQRIIDCDPAACMTKYLEFPFHYCLTALVAGKSFDDIHRIMNRLDDPEENQKVVLLSQLVRPATHGDVIVTPDGVPMFVAETGYLALPHALLS